MDTQKQTNIPLTEENRMLILEGIDHIKNISDPSKLIAKLGVSVAYQMACIGIEAILTGVLFQYNEVIEHGNILLMLKKLSKHIEIDEKWFEEARFINRFENFCSLDIVPQKHPDASDFERIARFSKEISAYAVGVVE